MKFPLVTRSKYENIKNMKNKYKRDYCSLKEENKELKKEYQEKIEKYRKKIFDLKNKHQKEINQVTEQVNEVIGDVVNLKRNVERENSDHLGKEYKFAVTAPIRLYNIFNGNQRMLASLLKRQLLNKIEEIKQNEDFN